ncbi:unnamed protein product [Umbelopsis ramanniana]
MAAVRDYLVDKSAEQKNPFDKIIFCFHTRDDEVIYNKVFPIYFPDDNKQVDRPEGKGTTS